MDEAIREVVLSLTANLSMNDRYTEFLSIFARITGNHVCALLRYQDGVLIPVATLGLVPKVLKLNFPPERHPRLAAILQSRVPVRFAANDSRPDPYDGLLSGDTEGKLGVHACVGIALYNENTLFGVLSADSQEPSAFDHIDDSVFRIFAALATVSLRYETYITQLEVLAKHRELVANELVNENLQRSSQTLGESPAMQNLSREIDIVSGSDLTVLLLGETGVGKEVIARIIHARSKRIDQPLVYLNCAALPDSLAESELFGHVKGAFSGATSDRAGKFELANGGTLFLDEVGELPLAIQAKLLRVVQFGEIQRVGSDKSHRADVRIIAATNRLLAEEVKEGRFRADLYHRLSVYPLHVAPLRERIVDIAVLSRFFLNQARARLGLERIDLSNDTLRTLENYSWPGNVRELEYVMLRAVLRASALRGRSLVLQPSDLDIGAELNKAIAVDNSGLNGKSLTQLVDDYQRQIISTTFTESGENWAKTARSLGMDRGNLHRLVKRLGMK
ncbi:nitric oxide reductase transcriptional regulator NorR [Methylicorpusculum sp.]|uniref:nitric oxide reductase transcriptional regulator NorR n=1 Tax=Methylicorpusculum sp. TaxID=2713644 RepID=UPI0027308243|nr:nitric oxide reductase transcriptional regulator NorR [Methylicorpusculum sp.]MDP2180312.1 nitric oxide reductase transcriptional regulator NorR [Methylicorpusculum sp.]MDZ4153244.1 nitric oxide reductase transcriptional regulator NorR [Methylicorpusculum sp.]